MELTQPEAAEIAFVEFNIGAYASTKLSVGGRLWERTNPSLDENRIRRLEENYVINIS